MTNEITRRTALKGLVLTAGVLAVPKVAETVVNNVSYEESVEFILFSERFLPYAQKIDFCIQRKPEGGIHGDMITSRSNNPYELVLPAQRLKEKFQERIRQEGSIRPMTGKERQSFIKNAKSEIQGLYSPRCTYWLGDKAGIEEGLRELMKNIGNGTMYNVDGEVWLPTSNLYPLQRIILPKNNIDDLVQSFSIMERTRKDLDKSGLKSFIDNKKRYCWASDLYLIGQDSQTRFL